MLRSFSSPRVPNDKLYSEVLYRKAKYRPEYPSRPFAGKEEAGQWSAAFVHWHCHEHSHSVKRFVKQHQQHSGQTDAICHWQTLLYEQARQRASRLKSRSVGCWQQPDIVWNNEP